MVARCNTISLSLCASLPNAERTLMGVNLKIQENGGNEEKLYSDLQLQRAMCLVYLTCSDK